MKMKNTILKMLRYSCLLFVIVFGLMAIIGSNGGGGGGDGGDDGGGDASGFTEITVGTLYTSVSIDAFDTHFYKFTPTSNGTHTISLTNLTSDMSWILFTNNDIANPGVIDEQDYFFDNTDEVGTTPYLTADVTYYLAVDEWENIASHYDLQITFP